ncbi:MAG: alanine--tRNA ligase, partial [Candidatus Omnitrophica bacterium]|nr:alanine--tRNA ligase [Candidatus Omnitrophota bacterium]
MQSTELRERFLSFFQARGHRRVPSDSLIPSGDPTVLFTSAGMNQFKDCFLGKRTDLARAASCQKCLRTGDLEQVGRTPSHHSFFEMLGNFSFGDYFKAEAVQWAWEFLTRELRLPAAKLWVSLYEEDDEAHRLWRALGVPDARIRRFGQAENFWPANAPAAGPNGPCGPCSELYYDRDGNIQGPNSVEVWNLVFTQYDRQPDGRLAPLPRKSIDTGMGLERLARVVQGVPSDYETDLFAPIMGAVRRLRGPKADAASAAFAERAIADHARAIVFLLAEGLVPSNESRGYVLRMLIRRTYRLARVGLGLGPDVRPEAWSGLITAVIDAMHGSPYSEALRSRREVVQRAVQQELDQFRDTLEIGTARLEELMQTATGRTIAGEEAFKLHDTYGFPLELTVDVAQERGFTVDRAGFEAALKVQQERSRASSRFGEGVFVTEALEVRKTVQGLPPKDAHFIGYDSLQADAVIKGLWDGTGWVPKAAAGQSVGLVLDRSPFYGESGGQVGDAGRIEGPKGVAEVTQTTWADDVLVHHATVRQGSLSVQDTVRASVDPERRLRIARSHTAAHMLHWALRKVLGPEAVQAGSYVEAERVRFDFSSLSGLREEQRH